MINRHLISKGPPKPQLCNNMNLCHVFQCQVLSFLMHAILVMLPKILSLSDDIAYICHPMPNLLPSLQSVAAGQDLWCAHEVQAAQNCTQNFSCATRTPKFVHLPIISQNFKHRLGLKCLCEFCKQTKLVLGQVSFERRVMSSAEGLFTMKTPKTSLEKKII